MKYIGFAAFFFSPFSMYYGLRSSTTKILRKWRSICTLWTNKKCVLECHLVFVVSKNGHWKWAQRTKKSFRSNICGYLRPLRDRRGFWGQVGPKMYISLAVSARIWRSIACWKSNWMLFELQCSFFNFPKFNPFRPRGSSDVAYRA